MNSSGAPGLRAVPDFSILEPRPLRLVRTEVDFGRRVVGVTTVLGVAGLVVLLGLALFHNVLAQGQFKLTELEVEVAAEQELLIDSRFRLEELRSPSEIERVAQDVLGLQVPVEPVDVVVSRSIIEQVASAMAEPLDLHGEDWVTVKPLLADS